MIAIERIQEQYDSSNKSYKGKTISGKKERATKQYFKDAAARARRKQGKVKYEGDEGETYYRHTTHRREEQPDAEDQRLEDIHFANFLGLKNIDGVQYNNVHIDEPVNIIECDIYLKPEPEPEEAAPQEEGDFQRQIECEEKAVAHLDLVYIPETKTLTSNGWYFKRGRDEDDIESQAKHIKMSDEESNFAAMVAYMKQQVELAQQMVANELTPCDCDHK
jgi:hypothetical protein